MKRTTVGTFPGLTSRVAPNACQNPSSWLGEAFVAKNCEHYEAARDVPCRIFRDCTQLLLQTLAVVPASRLGKALVAKNATHDGSAFRKSWATYWGYTYWLLHQLDLIEIFFLVLVTHVAKAQASTYSVVNV